jgi:hypothetical protein
MAFSPSVRKEDVQAVGIISLWATPSYLPTGHALRMGLALRLNNAFSRLEKNASLSLRRSSPIMSYSSGADPEGVDLVTSARTWLVLWLHDVQ